MDNLKNKKIKFKEENNNPNNLFSINENELQEFLDNLINGIHYIFSNINKIII
jgi:hypothetical protein